MNIAEAYNCQGQHKPDRKETRQTMEYLDQYIRSKLQEKSDEQGHPYTLADLARDTGLPRTTITNLIGSNRTPSLPTVAAIASTLHVPITEVIEACGLPIGPERHESAIALRYGRVIASITPLRELYHLLKSANLAQIEQVLAFARGVVTPREE
jgi:transcriptional regulator with XRE-family HTH domain